MPQCWQSAMINWLPCSSDLCTEHDQNGFPDHLLYGVLHWCHQGRQERKELLSVHVCVCAHLPSHLACVCLPVSFFAPSVQSLPLPRRLNYHFPPLSFAVRGTLQPWDHLGQHHELRERGPGKPADASECLEDLSPETCTPICALGDH